MLSKAEELARDCGVCTQTIRALAKAGKIPAFRIGRGWRFDHDAVMAAIKKENTECQN